MELKKTLALSLFSLVLISSIYAAPRKKSNVKLISAYTHTIPEEKQSNPPMAGYFFVIKWLAGTYPETFFWRGENGWLSCNIEKAVKGKKGYTGKTVDLDKIRKDDILLLTPLTGGRFPIPEEIPVTSKNALYYKTGGSGWLSLTVGKISRKN